MSSHALLVLGWITRKEVVVDGAPNAGPAWDPEPMLWPGLGPYPMLWPASACWSLGREPTENSAPKGSLRVAIRP
jgi:hypothetical protein